jgi:hypothetical protein
MYCRYGIFPITQVLPLVVMEPRKELQYRLKQLYENWKGIYHKEVCHLFDSHQVKMDSLRYQLFKTKGTTCVSCKLEAQYFALEAFKSDAQKEIPVVHFNLYAIQNGKEILFTKDHIHPKSKGGKDVLENMQTMCEHCNCKKSDK